MLNRKLALILILLTGFSFASDAQCDKKFKLKAERAYELNNDSTEGQSIPVAGEITISKDSILVLMNWQNGGTTEVKGIHTKVVCRMNNGYTEGSIDLATDAEITAQGKTNKSKMVFKIESKDGNMKVFGSPESGNDKICFVIKDRQEIH